MSIKELIKEVTDHFFSTQGLIKIQIYQLKKLFICFYSSWWPHNSNQAIWKMLFTFLKNAIIGLVTLIQMYKAMHAHPKKPIHLKVAPQRFLMFHNWNKIFFLLLHVRLVRHIYLPFSTSGIPSAFQTHFLTFHLASNLAKKSERA